MIHMVNINFNYHMVNTFLVIFLNQKVRSILNPIRKFSLSILSTTFWTTKKKKKTYSTKKVKEIKINLDFIFNNFLVHHTDLQLVLFYFLYLQLHHPNAGI